MAKQLKFKIKKQPVAFGGSLLKSNPKVARPLATRLPIHLTLKAARGGMRQPITFGKVDALVYKTAKKYGVKIYRYANVGDHLHAVIKLTRRELWAAFIRELTSKIVALVGFKWKHRPHTRIIGGWRRAFRIACDYIYLNQLEADGMINRRETKTLKHLRAIFSG